MARRGGWRRIGGRRRFHYVDSRGDEIVDEERLGRIERLVIPPAWRDVWISPSPGAKLQATGVDAAGRRQYLYHPAYRAAREQEKFDRLVRFGELLPGLRKRMALDVDRGPYEHAWTCAIAVALVNRGWFRVGSDRYARTGRTYGITTLTKRHVTVRKDRIAFRFRGKHGARVRTTLVDAELADAVRALLRFERDGRPANLTAPALNLYIAEHLGDDFTAKDFRTWSGTVLAATALREVPPPGTKRETERNVNVAIEAVAGLLGNTPTVCRKSYVHPGVVDAYRDRTMAAVSNRKRAPARIAGLRADEVALLALLKYLQNRDSSRTAA